MIFLRAYMPAFQYWPYAESFAVALRSNLEHWAGKTSDILGWDVNHPPGFAYVNSRGWNMDGTSAGLFEATAPM